MEATTLSIATTQTTVAVRQFTETEMRRYFSKPPVWPIPVGILGALGLLIGLANVNQAGGCALVGVILLVVAGIVFYTTTQGTKPTDAEYDAWVDSHVHALEEAGLRKLNLDRSQLVGQPLPVRGIVVPTLENFAQFGVDQVLWKVGKDNITRFSINTGKYFFPTEHHLSAFSDIVSALNQGYHREQTEQFFYNDINGVTTSDRSIRIVVEKKGNVQVDASVKSFDLISSSSATTGATVAVSSVSFGGKKMIFQGGDRVDNTVNVLRKLLNDKKGANQQMQAQTQAQLQQQMLQMQQQMLQQMMQMGQGGASQNNPNAPDATMPGNFPPTPGQA
jgi:hypothetical protein